MKLLLLLFLAAQTGDPECPAELRLRGVGATATEQVAPYARCLSRHLGPAGKIRASCQRARARALAYSGPASLRREIDEAVHWLDAMIEQRSSYETHLAVDI